MCLYFQVPGGPPESCLLSDFSLTCWASYHIATQTTLAFTGSPSSITTQLKITLMETLCLVFGVSGVNLGVPYQSIFNNSLFLSVLMDDKQTNTRMSCLHDTRFRIQLTFSALNNIFPRCTKESKKGFQYWCLLEKSRFLLPFLTASYLKAFVTLYLPSNIPERALHWWWPYLLAASSLEDALDASLIFLVTLKHSST